MSEVRSEDLREFILHPDWMGRTALHTAPSHSIAATIIFQFPDYDLEVLIFSRDFIAQSPLHYARSGEIAELLIQSLPSDKYIMHPSWFTRTALHEVRKLEVARVLVERFSQIRRVEFVMWTDWNGETAIDLAIKRGKTYIAKYLIQHLDFDSQERYCDEMEHPESRTNEYEDLYEGTENNKDECMLVPDFNISNLIKSGGLSRNNPLFYVVACQDVGVVVESLQPFSAEKIHSIVTHRNAYGMT